MPRWKFRDLFAPNRDSSFIIYSPTPMATTLEVRRLIFDSRSNFQIGAHEQRQGKLYDASKLLRSLWRTVDASERRVDKTVPCKLEKITNQGKKNQIASQQLQAPRILTGKPSTKKFIGQIGRSARPTRILVREKPAQVAQDLAVDIRSIEQKIDHYAESTLGRASQKGERQRGTGRLAKHDRVMRQNQAMREGIHEALKILSATIR